MVLDPTKNGTVGQLVSTVTLIGTVVATCTAVIVGTNAITGRLDRNYNKIESVCLAQKALDADLRLHILLESRESGHIDEHDALEPFPSIDC